MNRVILQIEGMTCSGCSTGLQKYLSKQNGVVDASVNLILSLATVSYEGIDVSMIEKYISEAGFKSVGEFKTIKQTNSKRDKYFILVMGLILLTIMFVSMSDVVSDVFRKIILVFGTILFLWYGKDILISGYKSMRHFMPNMDTLVLFSVLASSLYSFYSLITLNGDLYFESTIMVIYFVKLGRVLEKKSKDKTKEALSDLVQITPDYAYVEKNGNLEKLEIHEVKFGDTIVLKAGEKAPVDGIVVSGKSYVDESFITGESKPVLKEKGSNILAGSVNYSSTLKFSASKIGKESTVSEVVKLVIDATNSKDGVTKIVDRICGYFVPFIIILSFLTFVFHLVLGNDLSEAVMRCVTVLVSACPCALGLATPLVSVIGSGVCASNGIYIRNSEVLEKIRNVDTLVLDKTGTLTRGKLSVSNFINYSSMSDEEILNIVGNIESESVHPIATAFSVSEKLEVKDFKNLDGLGVCAKVNGDKFYLGNRKMLSKYNIKEVNRKDYDDIVSQGISVVVVVRNEEVLAIIGVSDVIREDAFDMVDEFKKLGVNVVILSGDNEESVRVVANQLKISEYKSECMPKDKQDYVKSLVNALKTVIMVGDGINDAPTLINASVGVSLSDGTGVSINSSDVILMSNKLYSLVHLVNISKRALVLIKENLFLAFLYNVCMLPLAMGIFDFKISPVVGSIAMAMSSVIVTLNSLRLRSVKYNER